MHRLLLAAAAAVLVISTAQAALLTGKVVADRALPPGTTLRLLLFAFNSTHDFAVLPRPLLLANLERNGGSSTSIKARNYLL